MNKPLSLIAAAWLVACGTGGGQVVTTAPDADTTPDDIADRDTGSSDVDPPDASDPADTEPVDTGTSSPDTDPVDTDAIDTGSPDTGSIDTGSSDTGSPDTGSIDTGSIDTGAPDTTGPVCGDGVCASAESALTCPVDCPPVCGDGVCGDGETFASCAADCDPVCGDDHCEGAESVATCPLDCPSVCGDDLCTDGESPMNCMADCGEVCTPYSGHCAGATPGRCRPDGSGWEPQDMCPIDTVCEAGACVGPIDWHLARSVDLQWVHDHPVEQLDTCGTIDGDLASGRIACDAAHGVRLLSPRFGYFLANSWQRIGTDGQTACGGATREANLDCYFDNLAGLVDRLQSDAPSLLLGGHIAEYVHRDNVDAAQWPSLCRAGTIGQWGADTCIPDLAGSAAARTYVITWGNRMIDAGIQALVVGQARLVAGGAADHSGVSDAGAAGLVEVIDAWRAHAAAEGRTVYIGAQAASSVRRSDGSEALDFVTGALHLEHAAHGTLVVPLLEQGPMIASHYGDGDWHDANLLVNQSGLPVLLDYDNSGMPERDDIRTLAAISDTAVRAQTLIDHVRLVHLYNADAYVSIPLSKTLATDGGLACFGVNQWHFSLNGCDLLTATQRAWAWDVERVDQVLAPLGEPLPPINRTFWGQALRDRHTMVSWFYRVFLDRAPDLGGYAYYVGTLPELINQGDGPRADFAASLVQSAEFATRGLSGPEVVDLIYAALLLREADAEGRAYWVGELGEAPTPDDMIRVIRGIAASTEAASLYAP